MSRRVVVTGYGMVSPVGNTVAESWDAVINGRSGIGHVTNFDPVNHLVKIAAEVKNFEPLKFLSKKEVNRTDPYQQFIVAAAHEAMETSGLEITDENRHRTSVIIGSAVGGLVSFRREFEKIIVDREPRKVSPYSVPMYIANGGSDFVSIRYGACGPSSTLVSACSTGADCIGFAYDLIRAGRIDRAMAGAAEYPVVELGLACFDRIRAIARNDGNPEKAIRPFDLNRSGMVMGEGGAVVVLEEMESAKARGANIVGELVGYGSTADSYHITAPDPTGKGAKAALQMALDDNKTDPAEVDYVNAHGTGTKLNDVMETKALKAVLGESAYNTPVSSTKSMTGHAMGATGAMEAIFSLKAIQEGIIPPTINYETPDPECDLDYVPNVARESDVRTAMTNSFGFGGHNASLLFKQFVG